jgi:hypothetical protein
MTGKREIKNLKKQKTRKALISLEAAVAAVELDGGVDNF